MSDKLIWNGVVLSVQPRIRLTRSYDERTHSYLGFVLALRGSLEADEKDFKVAIGKAAQEKNQFRIGDQISGEGLPVADPRMEMADLFKASKLKVIRRPEASPGKSPPFVCIPKSLKVYRSRGHRRLASRTYSSKCTVCVWGCEMPVEMIVDHWNPSVRRYRSEIFCYGPKSCRFYKAGPKRKVPGRKGMSYTEEDWVDEDETAHRGADD